MKANPPWTTYRTRFLVKAKQLATSLTFTDTLGRHHSGRKGDYLVESSDGVLRIAPRQIFEDIYVPLRADQAHTPRSGPAGAIRSNPGLRPELGRKSPQLYRSRSSTTSGLRSL
jgi:hypothetical protein